MNRTENENQLIEAMRKLEAAAEKLLKTSGYSQETKKTRLLIELIKEQTRNENPVPPASALR